MKPAIQAIMLADHVYCDSVTKKYIVCGTFTTVWFTKVSDPAANPVDEKSESLPVPTRARPGEVKFLSPQTGTPYAYFSLTDFAGTGKFALRIVDLSNFEVLFNVDFQITCNDRLETIQQAIALPRCIPGDRPGTYVLELLFEDEPIGSWRVRVIEMKKEDQP